MKKMRIPVALLLALTAVCTSVSAAAPSGDLTATHDTMKSAMILLYSLLAVMVVVSIAITVWKIRTGRNTVRTLSYGCYVVTVLVLVCSILCQVRYQQVGDALLENPTDPTQQQTQPDVQTDPSKPTDPTVPDTTEPSVPPAEPDKEHHFPSAPAHTKNSDPKNWGVKWDIIKDESVVSSYTRPDDIYFGQGNDYFALPGVCGFRGNNYREGSSYGTVNMASETLTKVWEKQTSSLKKSETAGGGVWTGSGWTGQPLVAQWDAETRQHMNLFPEKKAKENLVEVIYATLDGHIYFYDMETGDYTRKPLNIGMAFKGSGALDPRGYPILYVGSGDKTASGKVPRMFVISLIDCSIMYERGHDEPLKKRSWRAFDSSPLVDAKNDTLIWPGECGLIYTIRLNTKYDKAAGKISVKPDAPVMARYTTSLNRTLGVESSAVIVDHYLYVADNGGMMFCVDLNNMKLIWAQKVNDDTNATPVFQWEDDGNGYLYTGTSMEFAHGKVYIHKINAMNGEIVWEKVIENVYFNKNVSGGILSSPILGKKGTDMEGLLIYPIAKVPNASNGILMALDTTTGKVVWQQEMHNYTWSSPVAVYTNDGHGYMILCDSAGHVSLMEGKTGKALKTIGVGFNVEASPVVFQNMLVVGTRGQRVVGIKIG